MRSWIRMVAALYPRSWREEFGDEFAALLDDVKPCWRVFGNVLGGAITMQMTTGNDWLKLVAATAAFGAIVATGMSFRIGPRYESTALVGVVPQPDPVRPASQEATRERAGERILQMQTQLLSRTELSSIIQDPRLELYREERRRMPLEDVIERMKRDIHIQVLPSKDGDLAPIVFSITFSYPDRAKARLAVRMMTAHFTEWNSTMNRFTDDAYRGFWRDMARSGYAESAPPPPPVGDDIKVLDMAGQPTEAIRPNRLVFLAWGIGVGLVLGVLAAVAIRRPRRFWQLTGFAVAGCVLAGGASFLIPNRYTSTAVMMLSPAQITEDPTAPLPAATPATAFLRQIEPELLSEQKLSYIIQDPRLNLYASQRATKPMEELTRNMLHDIHISPLNSFLGMKVTPSAFTISFTYSDKYKAQMAVQALMNTIDELNQSRQMAEAAGMSATRRMITQRKAGEVLDVLDTASLPVDPVWPNRLVIAACGLAIGLLIGALTLRLKRPRIPALQPA